MKAAVYKKFGAPEVLKIEDVEKPVPKVDEILIEVKASAVTNSDIFIRGSKLPLSMLIPFRLMMGIFKPRKPIPGLVFSGIVRSTGKKITRFNIGDEVYGMTGFRQGAYAEFCCLKEKDSTSGCVSLKPKNITHGEATSAVYGGSLALQFMVKGKIKKGQNILIYGASGTSGTIAVQHGKNLGASVTGVCSGRNFELVRSLGADDVIDYTVTNSIDSNIKYDFILDSVGTFKTSELKKSCKNNLTSDGSYASIDDEALKLDSNRLSLITSLIESGKLKPVLDREFNLEEIVEAHKYVENGHKIGGVSIKISD